jgi:hypothetical protein
MFFELSVLRAPEERIPLRRSEDQHRAAATGLAVAYGYVASVQEGNFNAVILAAGTAGLEPLGCRQARSRFDSRSRRAAMSFGLIEYLLVAAS